MSLFEFVNVLFSNEAAVAEATVETARHETVTIPAFTQSLTSHTPKIFTKKLVKEDAKVSSGIFSFFGSINIHEVSNADIGSTVFMALQSVQIIVSSGWFILQYEIHTANVTKENVDLAVSRLPADITNQYDVNNEELLKWLKTEYVKNSGLETVGGKTTSGKSYKTTFGTSGKAAGGKTTSGKKIRRKSSKRKRMSRE